jgi:hypothetical protein
MTAEIRKIKADKSVEQAKSDIMYAEKLNAEIEIDLYEIDSVVGLMKWLIVTGRLYTINNYILSPKLRREVNNLVYTYWRM